MPGRGADERTSWDKLTVRRRDAWRRMVTWCCLAPVEPGISAGKGWPTLSLGGFLSMTQKRKRLSGPEKIAHFRPV